MPLFSDLLNRIDSGTEINSLAYRLDNSKSRLYYGLLIIVVGHPSGPGDLLFCRAISLLKTTVGVISMESFRKKELVESTVGIFVMSLCTGEYTREIFIKKSCHFNIGVYYRTIRGNQLNNTRAYFCS